MGLQSFFFFLFLLCVQSLNFVFSCELSGLLEVITEKLKKDVSMLCCY
jgi:hypothetical protein